MKLKAAIPADQLPAILETVKAAETKAHTDYLTELGLEATEITELSTLISETVVGIYKAELGETDGEMPTDETVIVSDTPDEAKSLARKIVKAMIEIKAGSTFSAGTKAKIAAINDSAQAHAKLAKAMHEEASASKEEPAKSAPEPEIKEFSLADYKALS